MAQQNTSFFLQEEFDRYEKEHKKLLDAEYTKRGLYETVNKMNAHIEEMDKFDHIKHFLKIGIGAGELFCLPTRLAHAAVEYGSEFKEYNNDHRLAEMKSNASKIDLTSRRNIGAPKNLVEALVMQKSINSLPPELITSETIALKAEIDAKVSVFKADVDDKQFQNISIKIHQLGKQQEEAYSLLKDSKLVIDNTYAGVMSVAGTLVRVENNMPTKEGMALFDARISALGINLTSQVSAEVKTLLAQGAVTQAEVSLALDYLEIQMKEKEEERAQQMIAQKYQGLHNAFRVLGQAGALAKCGELIQVATVAQAGIEVYRAVTEIAKLGMSAGLALLNPVSAIGMAALSIFSLFQKNNDPNKIIMKQLTQISKQIQTLHKSMSIGFDVTNKNIAMLFNTTISVLNHIEYMLQAPISRQLSVIEKELRDMLHSLNKLTIQIKLTKLESTTRYVDQLADGRMPISCIDQSHSAMLLCDLSDYLLLDASHESLNGMVNSEDVNNHKGGSQRVADIISRNILYQIGLMFYFAKSYLQIAAENIEEHQISQPELWFLGIKAYFNLYILLGDNNIYDVHGENVENFVKKFNHLKNFLILLRTNHELYKKSFLTVDCHTKLLQKDYDDLIALYSGGLPKGVTLASLDNESMAKQFLNTLSDDALIECLDETITEQAKRISVTKRDFITYLNVHHIQIPREYILAAMLGIGRFKWTIHYEKYQCDEHRILKGKAGFILEFASDDKTYPILSAGTLNWNEFKKEKKMIPNTTQSQNKNDKKDKKEKKNKKEKKADEIAKQKENRLLVLNSGTKIAHTQSDQKEIFELVLQKIRERKRNFAEAMTERLSDNIHYHALVKTNYFLYSYLICAGFPKKTIDDIRGLLFPSHLEAHYRACAKNPGMELGKLSFDTSTLRKHLDQLIDFMRKVNNLEDEKKYFFERTSFSDYITGCEIYLNFLVIAKNLKKQQRFNQQVNLSANIRHTLLAPPISHLPRPALSNASDVKSQHHP